ncbi:MAG: polysaccharide pyruvyl transferase family protein, partial [Clostridiaceae bacterium]|nr:polysaccharide pyruvyl transferase family protein [Clostridiaceae bacterium]
MKIGIITMPLCANYGGTLQNWALQQVFIRLGHEPLTLRFPFYYQGMSSIHYWLKVFPLQIARFILHKFIGGKYEMPLTIGPWRRSVQGMERFVNEHIIVTEYLPKLSMDDVYRYGVEVLVVGSDQIWRPVMYDAIKYYFLGFAKDSDILRIAYAPSIALDIWPYKKETTVQLRELIKKFSAVSVREESSVKLVKEYLGVDAQWVLDPTMLLKKEDYLEVCKDVPQNEEPFVFAYILDMTEDKRIMAEQTAKTLGCSVRYLSAGRVKSDDTIEKWLANIRDSVFVITDSY